MIGPFPAPLLFEPQLRQRVRESAPLLEQFAVPAHAVVRQAVVLPGGAVGGLARILFQIPVPAQTPEKGVDGALLGVGKRKCVSLSAC